jgi:hypothetical protein
MGSSIRSSAVSAFFAAVTLAILFGLGGGVACAANLSLPPASPSAVLFAPPTLFKPERFEPGGSTFTLAVAGSESGSVDANIERVTPTPILSPAVRDFLAPRFDVGGILNTGGNNE